MTILLVLVIEGVSRTLIKGVLGEHDPLAGRSLIVVATLAVAVIPEQVLVLNGTCNWVLVLLPWIHGPLESHGVASAES